MAKLSPRDGNERVIPIVKIGDKQFAVVEANPDKAGKAVEEVNHLNPRRVELIPAGVVGGVRGQGRGWRDDGLGQLVGNVSADRPADLVEGIAISGVDAVEISDTVVWHVRHVGQSSFDAAVVPVV